MSELSMWTVYDHPKDHPDHFIARRWDIGIGRGQPTSETILSEDLGELRDRLIERYPDLYCIPRQEDDDPVIVETWL